MSSSASSRPSRRRPYRDRPPGHAYAVDGRHITDEPGLYLALGEAVNGPGGYFGGCLDALADCLSGDFGYTAPATLLWHDASTAREHLSQILTRRASPSTCSPRPSTYWPWAECASPWHDPDLPPAV
ncbi:barstar family protein [Actinomadura sp. NPDC049753]|uniref:barstar family protein n=1 Tax=Actinomadura sp. NPDC049753 TaxID=3154739 RepID=UPI00342F7246